MPAPEVHVACARPLEFREHDIEPIECLLDEIFDQDSQFDVSYYELSSECDIRVLVVRTLL